MGSVAPCQCSVPVALEWGSPAEPPTSLSHLLGCLGAANPESGSRLGVPSSGGRCGCPAQWEAFGAWGDSSASLRPIACPKGGAGQRGCLIYTGKSKMPAGCLSCPARDTMHDGSVGRAKLEQAGTDGTGSGSGLKRDSSQGQSFWGMFLGSLGFSVCFTSRFTFFSSN